MIRWVFLDVGNVIMNDDPTMALLYEELYQAIHEAGVGISFEELLSQREEDIRQRGPGHWYRLGERYLGTDGLHALMHRCATAIRADYMACHNLLPGMEQALERLASRYSLGILANQLRESVDALAALGLRRHFRVLAVSELIGMKKPDPEIFAWALEQADAAPDEAVMVGDRIDNDIVPARQAGLWTVWFHAPLEAKGYVPPAGRARQHYQSQMRESISRIGPGGPHEEPDGEAASSAELVREIDRLHELSRFGRPLGPAPGG